MNNTENTFKNVTVPRSSRSITNKDVTKKIETEILSVLNNEEFEPRHKNELLEIVRIKFAKKYGWDLEPHVAWALDMLHFNNKIKRVAPATFESINGPDDVYSERETGHAKDGEFFHRGFNVNAPQFSNKKSFNAEINKAKVSVNILKKLNFNQNQIEQEMLKTNNFHPVAIKLASKIIFGQLTV